VAPTILPPATNLGAPRLREGGHERALAPGARRQRGPRIFLRHKRFSLLPLPRSGSIGLGRMLVPPAGAPPGPSCSANSLTVRAPWRAARATWALNAAVCCFHFPALGSPFLGHLSRLLGGPVFGVHYTRQPTKRAVTLKGYGSYFSEGDGTRTRNHRIDSPVAQIGPGSPPVPNPFAFQDLWHDAE
jgi:hypothetical protein